MNPSDREQLIAEAEAYQRDGMLLPLDLYSALITEGIDPTQYTNTDTTPTGEDEEIHNVD